MLNKLFIFVLVVVTCLAQDYEEYEPQQPQQTRSSGPSNPSRYLSQQKEEKTEPAVAILKQINRHNEDGSYTYGYEASDGSFKIETKAANGEVKGKYGYTDIETGKVRVVEYGANKYGFQPSGDGITVAPINFNDVKDEVEYEDEQPQQQFVTRPKQTSKVAKSQAIKYAPVSYNEQREPSYAPQPAVKTTTQPPRYYEYEEETTQRTIQYVQQQQIQQSKPSRIIPPQSAPRQHQYDVGIVYSQEPRPMKSVSQQKYQQYLDRSPPVFPSSEQTPQTPMNTERAQQSYSLFSPAQAPASPRFDVYRPQKQQFDSFPSQEPNHFAQAPRPQQAKPVQQYQQFEPQSHPQQRPSFASQPTQSRATSILDELVKDPNYKIPQTSNPLHDISFGYSV